MVFTIALLPLLRIVYHFQMRVCLHATFLSRFGRFEVSKRYHASGGSRGQGQVEDEDKDKDMKSNEDKRTYIGSKRAETREPRGQGQTDSEDRDTWKMRTGANGQ